MNKEETILSNIDAIKDSFYTDILDIPTKEDILNQVQCCIIYLQEENKRLKELCDKYEEEHNSTFKMWVRVIKERDELQDRIDKAINYIKDNGIIDLNGYDLLDILRGKDNE